MRYVLGVLFCFIGQSYASEECCSIDLDDVISRVFVTVVEGGVVVDMYEKNAPPHAPSLDTREEDSTRDDARPKVIEAHSK